MWAFTANASTEHIVEQVGIKFSVMRFIAQSNILPVHHAITQQMHEIWAKCYYSAADSLTNVLVT